MTALALLIGIAIGWAAHAYRNHREKVRRELAWDEAREMY